MKKWLFICIALFTCVSHALTPLPASEVFIPTLTVVDPNTLLLEWKIAEGAYLYKDRITLETPEQANVSVGTLRFPQGEFKEDAVLGKYEIYRHLLSLPTPILGLKPGDVKLILHFQGCTDVGFCYPPTALPIQLTIGEDKGITKAMLVIPSTTPIIHNSVDETTSIFQNRNLGFVLLSFFGFGLLLAFTPCVLPMVPVLSGIIVGQENTLTTRHAFFLSLIYVLSMAFTYALVGMLVATLGSNLQIALQLPWVIVLFSSVFVILALSMFDLYELKLPLSWQAGLAKISHRQKGGQYIGVMIMGCLSTLILSPCVTAPLVGALAYIAQSGDRVLGALALFSLGLGMGAPLILIGTTAGHLVPKAGLWMNQVKTFFGVMLIATAIYLLSRILPPPVTLALWAALLIVTSSYLWRQSTFMKGCALIAFVYGVLLLVGASLGNDNPLQPLANLSKSSICSNQHTRYVVTNREELTKSLLKAKAANKAVLVDFYADWCVACKVMERTTLADPVVRQALERFEIIIVDITQNGEKSDDVRNAFNVVAPPTYLFIDSQGVEVPSARIVGEAQVVEFLSRLELTH